MVEKRCFFSRKTVFLWSLPLNFMLNLWCFSAYSVIAPILNHNRSNVMLNLYQTIAKQGTLSFLRTLPNPDVILRATGRGLSAYNALLYDAHVHATVMSRKANLLSREIIIEPYNATLEALLANIDFTAFKNQTFNAVLYGHQAFEIMYAPSGFAAVPVRIADIPPQYVSYNSDGAMQLRENESLVLPENKFISVRSFPSQTNPYGEALLARIYWVVEFKRNALQYWIRNANRFATPTRIGTLSRELAATNEDGTNENLNEFANLLTALVDDNIGVIPEGNEITQLPSDSTDSSNTFRGLVELCNAEISKCILGQTLTTEIPAQGSYAAAEVHASIRREIVEYDVHLTERAIADFLNAVARANNLNETFSVRLEDTEQVKTNIAQRDQLLYAQGVRFTPDYYAHTYNLKPSHFTVIQA